MRERKVFYKLLNLEDNLNYLAITQKSYCFYITITFIGHLLIKFLQFIYNFFKILYIIFNEKQTRYVNFGKRLSYIFINDKILSSLKVVYFKEMNSL